MLLLLSFTVLYFVLVQLFAAVEINHFGDPPQSKVCHERPGQLTKNCMCG